MNTHTFFRALMVAAVFLGVQLVVGCDGAAAFGFAVALFTGWCACEAAKPWKSLLGLLTISLYVKMVFFGCAAKTLLLEPMDEGVRVPVEMAAVLSLGFAGVWLAVLFQRIVPLPPRPLAWLPEDPRALLALWVVVFVLGGLSWLFIFLSSIDIIIKTAADISTTWSRIYHIPSLLSQFFPFAPAIAIFYVAKKGEERLVTHPLVIVSLIGAAIPGVLEAAKQGIMQPLAAAWVSILVLRGPRYRPLWILTLASVAFFVVLVFPLVQATRGTVRQAALDDRLGTIEEVSRAMLGGGQYGNIYEGALSTDLVPPYLPRVIAPLDRFVRYVEASRLVEATLHSGEYTGFFTIVCGLEQIPPRFLYPDRKPMSTDNWLSRYTGDANPDDEITNFAYGFMASFFNGFGYWGTLIGSFVYYALVTYWLRLFVEDRRGPNCWIIMVFVLFDTRLVESCAGANLYSVWLPLPILFCTVPVRLYYSWTARASAGKPGAVKQLRPVQVTNSVVPRAS